MNTLTYEEARQYVKTHAAEYLKPDGSKKGFICPICNSGTGPTGTGITTKDNIHFTCWKGCFTSADIFEIIGKQYNLADGEAFKKAYSIFNIEAVSDTQPARISKPEAAPKDEETDYKAFFSQAHENISKTDYPARRGLSPETVARFNLGYIEKWQSPTALRKGIHPPYSPRLIIPTGSGSYVARDTRSEVPTQVSQYKKMKEGHSIPFNMRALDQTERPVFIVEGETDAMSIYEAGGEAVALGSVSNVNQLLKALETSRPAKPLIIALDNDHPGQQATQKLTEGLKQLEISFYKADITTGSKDANEALTGNRAQFTAAVQRAEARTEHPEDADAEASEKYRQTSARYHLNDFISGIRNGANTEYIPTGFTALDDVLDGGLYEGLYILGAISSLGKTTYILQIADQIAQQGKDVIVFSLEMARSELMAKSISRLSFTGCIAQGIDRKNAKTTRGITTRARHEYYSDAEKDLIRNAVAGYAAFAGTLYILEGTGEIGTAQIRQTVEEHIRFTGNKPVIVIDYLQILAAFDPRMSDKQNTDKTVLELKRISREFKIPIVGISSFNRANYNTSAAMEAFKESGAIEYSSDVLLGLQLKGVGCKDFDVNIEKSKDPREVELVVLKNRNGASGRTIEYDYFPMFNCFEERGKKGRP